MFTESARIHKLQASGILRPTPLRIETLHLQVHNTEWRKTTRREGYIRASPMDLPIRKYACLLQHQFLLVYFFPCLV